MLRALEGLFGLIAAVAGGIAVAVTLERLTWEEVRNWFVRRQAQRKDGKQFAFSLMEYLKNGEYSTVCGIFDEETEAVVDAKKYRSRAVDEQLADLHREHPVVIYADGTGD